MPGAWLHTPAKTTLMKRSSSIAVQVRPPRLLPVLEQRIQPGAHRTVFPDALPHRFGVLLPFLSKQRGVVHQDLPVHAHHVEQPDVAFDDRVSLLVRELVLRQEIVAVLLEPSPDRGIAVQLIKRLLHVIKTHDDFSIAPHPRRPPASYPPNPQRADEPSAGTRPVPR